MLLTAELADNRDSGKDFPGYQVQRSMRVCSLVNFGIAIWNSTKITIRMMHCGSKDPGHGGIGLENLDHASDAKDGRIQNDSEHHGHNLLHLLHIVGTSRDQGCSGKFMIFVAGE